MDEARITSRQNPRIRQAARLRQRRARQQQGRFLIDGVREIERAVNAQITVGELVVCDPPQDDPAVAALIDRVARSGALVHQVTPSVFSKLAYGDRESGLVAVAQTPHWSLPDWDLPAGVLIAVLENVEKPGNVGAVLRSADAAGVGAVIVTGGGVDLLNPNVIRASAGTVFSVPCCSASNEEVYRRVTAAGMPIFAARADAETAYTEVDLRGGGAIVVGSEASGLSDFWRQPPTRAIAIPMLGLADSLNASITSAILFYEALRQRRCSAD